MKAHTSCAACLSSRRSLDSLSCSCKSAHLVSSATIISTPGCPKPFPLLSSPCACKSVRRRRDLDQGTGSQFDKIGLKGSYLDQDLQSSWIEKIPHHGRYLSPCFLTHGCTRVHTLAPWRKRHSPEWDFALSLMFVALLPFSSRRQGGHPDRRCFQINGRKKCSFPCTVYSMRSPGLCLPMLRKPRKLSRFATRLSSCVLLVAVLQFACSRVLVTVNKKKSTTLASRAHLQRTM